MIVRIYTMRAAEGLADELRTALSVLAARIGDLAGVVRVDILSDQRDAAVFLFMETWQTEEAAVLAGKTLGRDAFAPIMAAVSTPPVSAQYTMT